jgi:acyl transferase domain-containing protein/acyl-CoA synthetase (AMP-forming)/AMP-acid ligase II/SAM-dependent methyltransferase/acyl carrier protein
MSENSLDPTAKCTTLVDILCWRALHQPDRRAYTFLLDGETEEAHLAYGELDCKARVIASFLQDLGASGERVLLLYPPGLEYIAAFFGCLYAGAVAVPSYPPRLNRPDSRLRAILADSRATVALTTPEILADLERRFVHTPELQSLRWVATDSLTNDLAEAWCDPALDSAVLAFLQYTSGSTATPKGVMVSHGNIMHNERMIQQVFGQTEESIVVGWLPIYHDMGLIGNVFQPLFTGSQCILMSPLDFLQRPVRWLQMISRYRACASGGPNFAYDLCVQKVTPEQRKVLDLSSWEVAFNGAEPVRHQTIQRFIEAFGPCGFRGEAFHPCYGLAEATLLVSSVIKSEQPLFYSIRGKALEQDRVVAASAHDKDSHTLVGCGKTVLGQKIVIVDPETSIPSPPNHVGEIWVAGRNVALGYWDRPDETEYTFRAYLADTGEGPFLRTGDLGFLENGELFVTGRLKDLIIIRGRNYYPQDIELTVDQCHPALQPGCSAVFSVDVAGEERLVVVQEVRRTHRKANVDEIARVVCQAIAEEHSLEVYAVVLLKPMSIPKTSSGKIQRRACREAFLSKSLNAIGEWRRTVQDPESCDTENNSRVSLPEQALSAEAIQAWLISHLSKHLGGELQSIDVRAPFTSFGLGSMQAVSLSGELSDWLGHRLSPTLAWEYPSIEALSRFLAGEAQFSVLKGQVDTGQRFSNEPIAIIGIGCRFPGANSPEAFWQLLRDGVDAITEVPPKRWDAQAFYNPDPEVPGKAITRWGGFLEDIDQFDPYFFGISPREAARIDPQQRLLLEITWEALENAGQSPDNLAGSRTGVFVGVSSNDYSLIQFGDTTLLDAYAGTGNANSITANRLSYFLDLRGPSLAVDTACSSSLVAVHLACQSLRNNECNLALAGGVNLILSPHLTVALSQARMLAADGRCKTFDASADGYVRGEGGGLVVLKRLSQAVVDGDRILAVLKGSAVNQDGRSNGLTAPNGLAQQEVIRRALADAAVEPVQVDYVEAHGTGTLLGDPIEVRALQAVFADDRTPDEPCVIGSVKTNIGHLEAAAGITGLIKVLLSMQYGEIPPHLHFKTLNPHISLKDVPLVVPVERLAWPARKGRRLAGVSSFGFGGTNAHVIVEEAPASVVQQPFEIERPYHVLTLSAKSERALGQLAARYASYLADHVQTPLADVCFTANVGRARFAYKFAAVAESREQLRQQLSDFSASVKGDGVFSGHMEGGSQPKIAFLFTGQGAQYPGMGRDLYETQPVFRSALERCAQLCKDYLERPLLEILYPTVERAPLVQAAWVQPALFAFEWALAEMWRSWGVEPNYVMGHSLGEYVAACVAGVMTLADGLRLVAERARLMQELPKGGMMAAVLADEARVAAALEPYQEQVTLAAVNGPQSTVISGTSEAVQAMTDTLRAQGLVVRPLEVSHAFHSPLMAPMLDKFEQVAQQLSFAEPEMPFISNVTGRVFAVGKAPDAGYWRRHIRETVRFADGINTLVEEGCGVFLELGPASTLIGMGKRCVPRGTGVWLPSLKRGLVAWQTLLQSLAELSVRGIAVDWRGFERGYVRHLISAPTYPFERQRCWLDGAKQWPQFAGEMSRDIQVTRAVTEKAPTEQSLETYYKELAQSGSKHEEYLTFAPFPEIVPGFSWILTFLEPEKHPEHVQMVQETHREMREALFRGLALDAVSDVLDIGCGYASDLIRLGKQHPHLCLDGCNISLDQIKVGKDNVVAAGLQDRIVLHHLDSAKDEFPGQYDLAVGCQVIHHIRDKLGVLSNVSRHLRNGGYLVLAEIISNVSSTIEHPESSAYFAPREEWSELLAENHLRIVDAVVVNREIGNFLYDPDFEARLADVAQHYDEVTKMHLRGPHLLGDLLKSELALYLLLTIQKDAYASPDVLLWVNREKLSRPTPYAAISMQEDGVYEPAFYSMQSQTEVQQEVFTQEMLLGYAPDERCIELTSYLCQQTAEMLKLGLDRLDPSYPLINLGLDSLMALQLKKRIEDNFDVIVPIASFFEGLSIAQLTQQVLEQIESTSESGGDRYLPQPEAVAGGVDSTRARELLGSLDQLEDAEVDSLLGTMLAEKGKNGDYFAN